MKKVWSYGLFGNNKTMLSLNYLFKVNVFDIILIRKISFFDVDLTLYYLASVYDNSESMVGAFFYDS